MDAEGPLITQHIMSTKRKKTAPEVMKSIAVWKSNHPEETMNQLSDRFGLPDHKIRYALEKYAEGAELMKNTRRGRNDASRYIAGRGDDIDLMRGQLDICIAELDTAKNMAVSTRLDLLYKAMRIKSYLQDIDVSKHIKSTDAQLIARIIRRFIPEATNEDVIKIYKEELLKWKNSKG
jgi:predicted transcriptional regulator